MLDRYAEFEERQKMGTLTDFDRLLARFEDMTRRCERMNKELTTERERNRGLSRANQELAGLERKLEEWVEYASGLRSIVETMDLRVIRRKKIKVPARPAPLETDIPF